MFLTKTQFIGPSWYSNVGTATKQKFVLQQEKYRQIYSPIFVNFQHPRSFLEMTELEERSDKMHGFQAGSINFSIHQC